MADQNDDLTPTQTAGFKVGEKKTVEEYQQLGKRRFSISTLEGLHPVVFSPKSLSS